MICHTPDQIVGAWMITMTLGAAFGGVSMLIFLFTIKKIK